MRDIAVHVSALHGELEDRRECGQRFVDRACTELPLLAEPVAVDVLDRDLV
jgi:hypothetical protein